MIWGVRTDSCFYLFFLTHANQSQWTVCGIFLSIIALAVAELGSAAPTSGGLYYWTFMFSSPRWRCFLSWIVGCKLHSQMIIGRIHSTDFLIGEDSNTLGNIASVASVDWGCAVQIMAAASIGSSDLQFTATTAQTLWVDVDLISQL